MIPRIITAAEREARRRGLGDRVQTVIHAGLDAVPMPAKTRAKIKSCAGCAKRVKAINKGERKAKSLLARARSKLNSLFSTSRP